MITKTRAVGEDGNIITAKQAAIRAISRFVPFEGLSIFFTDANIMWHDRWTDTLVINETASGWNEHTLL